METVTDFMFWGSKITAGGDCSHEIQRCLLLGRKAITNLHSALKIRDITLPTKVHLVKALVFLVAMYGCESWTTKKSEHWRIDALNCGAGEFSWDPLGCKMIKSVNPEGNQPWIFIGRTEAETEILTFYSPDVKNQLVRKDPDAGKDWGQEEKGTTKNETVG